MVLPGPVSWVEIQVQLDDPQGKLSELGMQLKLNLDRPSGAKPTLAELGAASVVYTSLYENYEMELRANSRSQTVWHILRGPRSNVRRFASATSKNAPPAQGWAHVMDRKRCLAIAFHQFGKERSERMRIQANGTLTAWRSLPQQKNQRKSNWRMWLHFVHYPYQWSAGASPQQMQNPVRFSQLK